MESSGDNRIAQRDIHRNNTIQEEEEEEDQEGLKDRKDLLSTMIRDADDHHQFLQMLKGRMDRVSLDLPTIEVRFENLNVDAEAYVGSRGLPTIINSFLNVIEGVSNYLHILPNQKKRFSILHNISGIIKPGRNLQREGTYNQVSGKVTYNGHEMHEFVPQRTSSYVSQSDEHIAQMTVRETLAFSARCQGIGTPYDMVMELLRREKELNIEPDLDIDILLKAAGSKEHKDNLVTDYILKILGLEDCADTIVGNEIVRGISGGQRRRVTIGEMLVGPARSFFMDNISTGLDSVTTFRIINSIRQSVHILKKTVMISLLQPALETYNLFDDIILISEGQIVYHGPCECVLDFFESMGFKCPGRKVVADYLQEVTSREDQKQYWVNEDTPYRYISVNEFAEAFQSFHIGKAIRHELLTPFDRSKCHPAALVRSKYATNRFELLSACLSRECILMKRNSFLYMFKIFQHLILAIISATLFGQSRVHHQTIEDGLVHLGALYCGLIATLFTGFFELPMTIEKLPVFYKQRGSFYPSWAYSLPTSIVKTPVSIIEVAIWVMVTYYAIGFDPTVERMFRQFLILALSGQMSYGIFRCIAALSRDHNVANTGGNIAMVWLVVFSGFALSRHDMKKWLIWGYWTTPLMYVQTALSINEFLGGDWKYVFNKSTEALGISVLKSRGIFTTTYWYWIGIDAVIGFIFLFGGIYTLALTYLNQHQKTVFLPIEVLQERHANRTGEIEGNKTLENENPSKNAIFKCREEKGMLLPFTPLSITFENIRYSIDMRKEKKAKGIQGGRLEILKGVSGAFRPGVLTALMGVSGAGKTTLLDILAGRKNTGLVEGTIKISGYPKKQKVFARVSGYCEQNDIHSPFVTVHESLLFSVWLRLPSNVKLDTRKSFVEEVMELIALTPLRDALVGFPGVNGLSVDQRKRLTIAVELVANPSIIFMDEPTTGLDSRAAAIVIRTVRNIVDTGRTVVCTIHQPSIEIFEAFDELFLLSQEGEEIYVGPLGDKSRHMIHYFKQINGVRKIEDGYNPATWMMEVTTQAEEELLGVKFADVYKNSDLFWRNKALIEELHTPPPYSKDLNFPKYSQPFLTQCKACLWRQHKSYWRNTSYNSVRLLYGVLTGFMLGIVFRGLGSRRYSEQDVLNGVGSMYTTIMFLATNACVSVLPVITADRVVFYRERAAEAYSAFPYAIAQVAIEIPYTLAQTLVYGIIVYAMIGFELSSTKFFLYLFFFFFTFLYCTYFGMMVVAISPNQEISATLCSANFTLWNVFSGFLIPPARIPTWWKWYAWVCPFSWSLYGLACSQYGDIQSMLNNGETVAEFITRYFGYKNNFLKIISIGTIGFAVIFACIFAVSISTLNFQKR
ncbi:ABC transporter G family member 39-like isoform X2 [Camellia sinensis]|uniref:ABC transporter G family member 39-like isoform X2 n=1 Tax=Camellia sinensis TaxID=4442 RepID=UPI001036EA9C|nr:ABC transporter G family member 39-like isoform X2 [Camellia sinensis]